jgi:hypothetical protein
MPYESIPYVARVATQFDVTASVVLAAITDLVIPAANGQGAIIEKGGIYEIDAMLMTTSAVDAGVKAAVIAGGATQVITATALRAQILIIDGAAAVPVTSARQTALGTGGGVTAVTVATITIKGFIVVNVPGAIAIGFSMNASQASTASVLTQSYFKLGRVDSFYQPAWQTPA